MLSYMYMYTIICEWFLQPFIQTSIHPFTYPSASTHVFVHSFRSSSGYKMAKIFTDCYELVHKHLNHPSPFR